MLAKIHLENFINENDYIRKCSVRTLSYVCGDFNELKHARRFINRNYNCTAHIFFPPKNMLVAPAPLTIFNKTYSTSAAPLLVIQETSVKSS